MIQATAIKVSRIMSVMEKTIKLKFKRHLTHLRITVERCCFVTETIISVDFKTAEILKDGIIYTADFARIDEEGRLRLMGRKDDVINIGGFKVAPTEVENIALSHPSVKDCICITGKHPVIGTVLKLLVVTKDGTKLDKHSLALYIQSQVERYKVPLLYEQVEKIQRTFNGKLDRKFYKRNI